MIVATVLRSGGPTYTPSWVWALKRQLNEHAPEGWEFRVLSDLPLNHWRIPLRHDWPGWWSKVELFRPGSFPEGHLVLYVDLDTLIVGSLEPFASYAGELATLSDFYRPRIIASGVMLFRPGERTARIYDAFRRDAERIMAAHRSRSDFWYAKVMGTPDRIQQLYPRSVVSLKEDTRGGPPEGAAIVCGHGKPRLSDPAAGWAHRRWAEVRSWAA